jgi:hypothetical protein
MPALPLDQAGKYVAGAYLVFLALVLVYVAIMAAKLARIDRELGELADFAEGERAEGESAGTRDEVPVDQSDPAARLAPEPGQTGREAEDLAGGIHG